ncbi:MAG: CRISPR-associated endonuclease Cas2 [Pseudomonadota bacterium]|nr:CRISPR-associated endonuclease Cas2 [Pseudomonadota bacterium]
MLAIICYDIADDRRRFQVARELEGWGWRVQESVFECLLDAAGLARLQDVLANLIDPVCDRLRYYSLCPRDRSDVECFGSGAASDEVAWWIV